MSGINCEIESKSDFLTGMYLVARIADSDVDKNALNTIQEDCPEFILPFNYKSVDGQTEFTYKVGTLSKLQYFYGDVSYTEYLALWKGILSPLLECGDWFMNPGSFVLSADYLYFDKTKNTVAYVYIPSTAGCSGHEAFNEMAVTVAKNIKVSDPVLENKVLRSIISGFNPNDFLKMILKHPEQREMRIPDDAFPMQAHEEASGHEDTGSAPVMNEKEEHAADSAQSAADRAQSVADRAQSVADREPEGLKIFSARSKKKKIKRNGFKNMIPADLQSAALPKPAGNQGNTQETKIILSSTGLRCVGRPGFPPVIEVKINDGEVFTIGRYDVSAGKKRSSFEFGARTKAISRRHAAIEREGPVYRVVDLSSSAGTYLNDKKLPPNTPAVLEQGCRVSFGNLGADYVWNDG